MGNSRFGDCSEMIGIQTTLLISVAASLTQDEFRSFPLVSSVIRPIKECPQANETEEIRNVDGEEVHATFVHDYSILVKSQPLVHSIFSKNLPLMWEIYHRPYLNCKSQDDPYLIQALQNDYITKPDISKEYSLNVPIEEIKEK